MAKCSYCSGTIVFGGEREGELRFCNKNCLENGRVIIAAEQVPLDLVEDWAAKIHQGNCPKCNGSGPVDVQTSYTVWSFFILSSWNSKAEVCCNTCGYKKKTWGLISSMVLGWWGFPWGIIMTPIQVIRNIIGFFKGANQEGASDQLKQIAKLQIAQQALEQNSVDEQSIVEN